MAAIGPRRIFQTRDAVMAQKIRVMVVIERRDSLHWGNLDPGGRGDLGIKGDDSLDPSIEVLDICPSLVLIAATS